MTPQEYGQNVWVCIVKIIDDHETKAAQELGHTQFICSINDDQYEEIMSQNGIINLIAIQGDEDIVGKFKRFFPIRDCLMNPISTTKYLVIM